MAEKKETPTNFDFTQVEKEAQALGKTLEKLGTTLATAFEKGITAQEKLAEKAKEANDKLKQQQDLVKDLKKMLTALQDGNMVPDSLQDLTDQLGDARRAMIGLGDVGEQVKSELQDFTLTANTDGIQQAKKELENMQSTIGELSAEIDKLNSQKIQVQADLPKSEKLKIDVEVEQDKLVEMEKQSEKTTEAAKKIGNPFTKLPNVLKGAVTGIKGVASGMGSALKVVGSVAGGIFKSIKTGITKVFQSDLMKKGVTMFTDQLKGALQSNSQFTTSLQGIQNNLKAAFQPIIDLILPHIVKLSGVLESASGYVKQFATALTGSGLEGMTLEMPTADTPQWMADMAKDVQEGDWTQIGTNIATSLSTMIQSIDFAVVGTSIGTALKGALGLGLGLLTGFNFTGLGQSIATMFNSLFQAVDLGLVGTSIGAALQGALSLGLALLTGIDFAGLGQGIAALFNGLFAAVDPTLVSESIGAALQGALALGLNLLAGLDLASFGEGIATLFNGLFAAVDPATVGGAFSTLFNQIISFCSELITTTDWQGIATWFSDVLNTAVSTFDWEGFGGIIGGAIISIVSLLSTFIMETDWSAIGLSFWNMLAAIDWTGIVFNLAQLLGSAIGGMGALLVGFIQTAVTNMTDYFKQLMIDSGGDVAESLWNGILDGLGNIVDWLHNNIVTPVIDGIKKAFGMEEGGSTVFSQFGKDLIQGLVNGIQAVLDQISGAIGKIKTAFTEGFKGIFNGIMTIAENFINWLVDGINKISFEIPEWLGEALGGGKRFGFNLPHVSLPRLATGSVVQPNKEFLAILGDNTREQEVVSPLSTMRQALKEALLEANFSHGGDTTVVLELDSRELGRAVLRAGNQERQRIGTQLITV